MLGMEISHLRSPGAGPFSPLRWFRLVMVRAKKTSCNGGERGGGGGWGRGWQYGVAEWRAIDIYIFKKIFIKKRMLPM